MKSLPVRGRSRFFFPLVSALGAISCSDILNFERGHLAVDGGAPSGGGGAGDGSAVDVSMRPDGSDASLGDDGTGGTDRSDVLTDTQPLDISVDVTRDETAIPDVSDGPAGDTGVPCDATTCPAGCCDANDACVPYPNQGQGKCGTTGAACGPCSSGQVCGSAGVCECTTASCSGGCCNGTTCILLTSQGPDQCGSGGNACGKCTSGQACTNGACTCGGTGCAGCCMNGTCQMSGHDACGAGGSECTKCDAAQECSAQGKCVCTPGTCPTGCCDANEMCQTSQMSAACGTGGVNCQTCAATQVCNNGQCDCNATTCPNGCCDANRVCQTTGSGSAQCGKNGVACFGCANGETCGGAACTCTATTCPSGCCAGDRCIGFASQSKAQCGAAKACGMCADGTTCDTSNGQCICNAATCPAGCCDSARNCKLYGSQTQTSCGTGGNDCSTCAPNSCVNGQCTCNSTSCSSGCCSGLTCLGFGSQSTSMCGTNGDACGACTGTQACSNGACIIPTWCTSQTPPSGVAIADYQCVDFDANTNIPAGWTSSASNGATITVSTEARSSSPNGLKGWVDIDSSGAYITWGNPGTNVSSVAIAADIQPVDNGSFPGEWTGSLDYLCAQVGQVKVCVSYNPNDISPFPSNVMRINYTDGLVSYTCPLFGTLPFLAWTRVTLTVTSSGIATVTSNSMLNGTCQLMQIPIGSTATFRAGVDVTPTIGASSTGYVDNVVAWIKR